MINLRRSTSKVPLTSKTSKSIFTSKGATKGATSKGAAIVKNLTGATKKIFFKKSIDNLKFL